MSAMILPGSTLGILGGGQLGRMLAVPARQLGYRVAVLAPEADAPAFGLADHVLRAAFEDGEALRGLADLADVITYEFENVAADTVRSVASLVPVRPGVDLLAATQDRLAERALCVRAGVPVARHEAALSWREIGAAYARITAAGSGRAVRVKTARGGYDGAGQWRVTGEPDLAAIPEAAVQYLVEEEISFEREISVIICRGVGGQTEVFPLFENHHVSGILALSRCPARVSPQIRAEAEAIARALADTVGLIGTLTVEMFVTAGGLVVNELAPRVHNSGHLTVEAHAVSQFEQHIRAVCGLPLLPPRLVRPAAMANLLGEEELRFVRLQGAETLLGDPDASLHLYGKRHSRARRKMGHVTVVGDDPDEVAARAQQYVRALRFVRGGS